MRARKRAPTDLLSAHDDEMRARKRAPTDPSSAHDDEMRARKRAPTDPSSAHDDEMRARRGKRAPTDPSSGRACAPATGCESARLLQQPIQAGLIHLMQAQPA